MANNAAQAGTSTGIGFTGLLTLIFITLKLTKVIGWSWWWVLSPIWISWAIALLVLSMIAVFFLITYLFNI